MSGPVSARPAPAAGERALGRQDDDAPYDHHALDDDSLYDHWRSAVADVPSKEAVVDARGTRLSYAQVEADAARLAAYLRSRGIGPGDVVSVQLPNWAEFLCIDVACLKIGAVVNPLLTNYRTSELEDILTRCDSRILVVPTSFRGTDYRRLVDGLSRTLRDRLTVLCVEHDGVASGHLTRVADAVATTAPLPDEECAPGRGTDVATVLFTSGSEARPKGVLLSHQNVLAAERSFAQALQIGPEDRVFMPAPLGHATGYLHGLTMPYLVRATSVLLDVVRGDSALAMINAEACTCAMATASVVTCLLDACREGTTLTPALRFLCCGGSPVPRRLQRRALAHGVRLHSVYGSTESAPHTVTTAADGEDKVVSTDGRPVAGVEVRVVDPVTRRPVAPGVEGEEASRGPQVFVGYLGDPVATARVLDADGWYYSGDLCVMDEEGFIRITGRRKDVIIRGGENISALEVESVVRDHPGVRDVAVVAMPDRRLGECACAFLVLDHPGATVSLDSLCRLFTARGLAKFKIPERVVVVDELPTTAAGKVHKAELRARIAAVVDREEALAARR